MSPQSSRSRLPAQLLLLGLFWVCWGGWWGKHPTHHKNQTPNLFRAQGDVPLTYSLQAARPLPLLKSPSTPLAFLRLSYCLHIELTRPLELLYIQEVCPISPSSRYHASSCRRFFLAAPLNFTIFLSVLTLSLPTAPWIYGAVGWQFSGYSTMGFFFARPQRRSHQTYGLSSSLRLNLSSPGLPPLSSPIFPPFPG